MSKYVKAEPRLKHSAIHTNQPGKYFRFSGGTWAWRNNNPGNLRPGDVSKRNNQISVRVDMLCFLIMKAVIRHY